MFSNQTFFYTLFILCQEEIIPLHTPYPHFRIFCSKNVQSENQFVMKSQNKM